MARAHADFETYSTVELDDAGAYAYAEHPDTGVYCLLFGMDEKPLQEWRPGWADPEELLDHVAEGGVFVAHNAAFEWSIWNLCLRGTHGLKWPELKASQMDDTMSRGLAMALPAKLAGMAEALGLPVQKDAEGRRLMLKMCKPIAKLRKTGVIAYHDSEANRARLAQYCAVDVEVERHLDRMLPPLSPREREIDALNWRINLRGVAMDLPAAQAAHTIVTDCMADANAELRSLTNEEVRTVNSHAKLAGWLRSEGVETENTQAETIELLLEREHPPHVQKVLEIRRDSGKASVTKLPAILAQTGKDGRAHFLFRYAGAGRTLRFAGQGSQPQNLQRPDFDPGEIEQILALAQHGKWPREMIDVLWAPPVTALSSCLRAMFVAAPGNILTASDLSNIEGRVAAWIAGETWKLNAFKAFDNKTGPDLYKLAYSRTFGGKPEDVSDDGDDRQIGKIQELFLQFEGGRGAFATGAASYGFDILEPGDSPRKGRRYIDAKIIPGAIKGWREAHPVITAMWKEMNALAIRACEYPNTKFTTANGAISFVRRRQFLFMTLPNGRDIPYFGASVGPGKYGKALKYWGLHSKTRQWCELDTYGGHLFQNAVQALARDIFCGGLLRVEKAGMPIVMHVHDAVAIEHVPGRFSIKDLSAQLCDLENTFHGLPVSAKGYTSHRFQK